MIFSGFIKARGYNLQKKVVDATMKTLKLLIISDFLFECPKQF